MLLEHGPAVAAVIPRQQQQQQLSEPMSAAPTAAAPTTSFAPSPVVATPFAPAAPHSLQAQLLLAQQLQAHAQAVSSAATTQQVPSLSPHSLLLASGTDAGRPVATTSAPFASLSAANAAAVAAGGGTSSTMSSSSSLPLTKELLALMAQQQRQP